jgi:hypothetical protein
MTNDKSDYSYEAEEEDAYAQQGGTGLNYNENEENDNDDFGDGELEENENELYDPAEFGGNEYGTTQYEMLRTNKTFKYGNGGKYKNEETEQEADLEYENEDEFEGHGEVNYEKKQDSVTINLRDHLIENLDFDNEAAFIGIKKAKQLIDDLIQEMRDDPYKNEPVTVEWLARFWMTAWYNPFTWGRCRRLSKQVSAALTAATSGWHYALTVIKFKYPFNPIGGLLELLDGPIGGIGLGIDVRTLLNFILGLPVIQHGLRLIRRTLYPAVRLTSLAYRKNLARKKIDKLMDEMYKKYGI